jgi:hypothetical protein
MRLHMADTHRCVPEEEHPVGRRAGEWSMSGFSLQRNAELQSFQQNYGEDPLADRERYFLFLSSSVTRGVANRIDQYHF